jgi:hypothetical protein
MDTRDIYGIEHIEYEAEREIYAGLIENCIENIGYGTSRVVFPYTKGKVIKLALTEEGILQNEAEYNCFCESEDNNVARIYAIGKLCLIVERVEPLDFDGGSFDDYYATLPDGAVKDALDKTIDFLDKHFGPTEDNYQFGTNSNGYIVAYDYGFDSRVEDCCVKFVGNIADLYDSYNLTDEDILKAALVILPYAYAYSAPNRRELIDWFLTSNHKLVAPTGSALKDWKNHVFERKFVGF